MPSRSKPRKVSIPSNELKASVIRRYGTITAFAVAIGETRATVYSALKLRRDGKVARRIRARAA